MKIPTEYSPIFDKAGKIILSPHWDVAPLMKPFFKMGVSKRKLRYVEDQIEKIKKEILSITGNRENPSKLNQITRAKKYLIKKLELDSNKL